MSSKYICHIHGNASDSRPCIQCPAPPSKPDRAKPYPLCNCKVCLWGPMVCDPERAKQLLADANQQTSGDEGIRYWIDQYLQAYAPDFFEEPPGFIPKLDMNSAALVRRTLTRILEHKECHDE